MEDCLRLDCEVSKFLYQRTEEDLKEARRDLEKTENDIEMAVIELYIHAAEREKHFYKI